MTSMHERIRKDKENIDQKKFNLPQSPRYLVKTQLKNLKDKWAKLDNVELTVKEFLMNIYFLFGEQLVNFLGYRMNQEGGEENENNVNDNANNAEENAEENPAVAEVEEMALGVNQEMVANNGANQRTCCICQSQPPTMAFAPCGHSNMCEQCATAFQERGLDLCPTCRDNYAYLVKIYY